MKSKNRPAEIDQAVKELKAAARNELAKKEVVQFRMDTDDLQRLYEVCALKRKPVGTLVREWVIENTERELEADKWRHVIDTLIQARDLLSESKRTGSKTAAKLSGPRDKHQVLRNINLTLHNLQSLR